MNIDWTFPDYGHTPTDLFMLEKAIAYAKSHDSGGSVRVYAIAIDKRGNVLSQAGNTYIKSHPKQKRLCFLTKQKGKEFMHAELRCIISALKTRKDIHKLYVARVDKAGNIKDGKPCEMCSYMMDTELPNVEVIWSREKYND